MSRERWPKLDQNGERRARGRSVVDMGHARACGVARGAGRVPHAPWWWWESGYGGTRPWYPRYHAHVWTPRYFSLRASSNSPRGNPLTKPLTLPRANWLGELRSRDMHLLVLEFINVFRYFSLGEAAFSVYK